MKVKSSQIAELDHDPDKLQLHVTFHDGHTYTYNGVDEKQYKSLLGAKSIGTHFSKHIKGKHIHHKRKK